MNLKTWAGKERGRGLLLAKTLGVKPPSVSDWITGKKRVPLERCMPINVATGGEVTLRELRPDDHHIHWPELALQQESRAQCATETVATAAAFGPERRHINKPQNPDLERRAPLAAALAGHTGV